MEATDPHHAAHAVSAPLAIGSVTVSNIVAWGQSVDLGLVTSSITGIGGAVLGILWGYYSKVVPARTKAEADRDAARSASLAGRLDRLNESLALAQDRTEAERELAVAAKERADQLHEMVQDLRAEAAKANERADQLLANVEELRGDVARANKKLHEANDKLQSAESRSIEAVMEIHAILDKATANNAHLAETRDAILAVLSAANRVGDVVREKSDQVVATVAEMVHPSAEGL